MANKYSSLSPYNYSFNDPVSFNDVNGADPTSNYFYGNYFTYDDWQPQRHLGEFASLDRSLASSRQYGQSLSNFSSGMTMGSFFAALSTLSRSTWGGTWSSNGQVSIFSTYADAVSAGIDYNFSHNSWGITVPGSYSSAAQAFENVTGIRFLPSVTIEEARSNSNFLNDRLNGMAFTNGGGLPRLNDPGYGFALSMVETAFISGARDLGILRPTSSRALAKRTLNAFTKTSLQTVRYSIRGSGMIGFVVGAGIGTYNIANRNGQLSDALDIGVTVLGGAAIFFASAAAAPAVITGVAAGSLIYGGFMLFGGEDYINNSSLGKSTKSLLNSGN